MSKFGDLPDETTEEQLESVAKCFAYYVGIKMRGEGLELHIDNGWV